MRSKRGRKNATWLLRRLLVSVLAFSPIIVFAAASMAAYKCSPSVKRPWVTWYDDPSTTVQVSWETALPTSGSVRFGVEGGPLANVINESIVSSIHHVNLTGLLPDSLYRYEVLANGSLHGSGTFRTAPADVPSPPPGSGITKPFTWVMFSDTQQHLTPGHHFRIARAIQDGNYSFAVIVGDLVEDGEKKEEYDNFFSVAAPYLDTIPLVPVIGNHDEASGGAANWNRSWFHRYFVQKAIPSHWQFFYSFNHSNVHFTICHFTWGRSWELTSTQLDWLEQDLARNQDRAFRVVFFHAPITGAGSFGPNANLNETIRPLLSKYNVSLLVSGHEHHYERGVLDGTVYLILGGGGGMLDLGLKPMPETRFMIASPSFTEVRGEGNALEITTRSPEGTVLDTYTILGTGHPMAPARLDVDTPDPALAVVPAPATQPEGLLIGGAA